MRCLSGPDPRSVAALISPWLLSACAVTFFAVPSQTGHSAATASYRAAWERDWTAVDRASDPWNAEGSVVPGACDIGGSRPLCLATDVAVESGLRGLRSDLRNLAVPQSYQAGHQALMAALATELRGLRERDRGLRGRGDQAAFARGVATLRRAAPELVAAYGAFPADDLPTPALFGAGRHAS